MEIKFLSVLVDDQDKALQFYTEKLGFVKKSDMADGDSPLRWLTVVSPGGDDGVELELQATHFPSAKAYQKDQFDAGYAFAILHTKDIYAEYNRLKKLGVVFRGEPEDGGQCSPSNLRTPVATSSTWFSLRDNRSASKGYSIQKGPRSRRTKENCPRKHKGRNHRLVSFVFFLWQFSLLALICPG